MSNDDPWVKGHWAPGVLSKSQIKILIDGGYIEGVTDFEKCADYSSFDLKLSKDGYRMTHGSLKPCGRPYSAFLQDDKYAEPLIEKNGVFELKANNCYVFRLNERFNANLGKSNIFGQATAKSSVGRMDVIARLIVDCMHQYDYFDSHDIGKATGQMYLEIIPISFNIRVKKNESLSQIRLFYGKIDEVIISNKEFIKGILQGSEDGEGYLSVDLQNTKIKSYDVVAFGAKSSGNKDEYTDLWKKDETGKPDPCKYWRFITSINDRIEITSSNFYIIRSKERISLPKSVAVYARAMDESLGEMRIHYAGFVHPFFGIRRTDDKTGTPLIFEVRGHNVNVNLAHGERLAKLIFYRMSEDANESDTPDDGNFYSEQELQLSKFFKQWPKEIEVDKDGNVSSKEVQQ